MNKLIGIFGGTFDPIHNGHLQAVSLLTAELRFDAVHWVLSARPPHKDDISSDIDARFKMLTLALKKHKHFIADDTEIKRTTQSYTYDTLLTFKHQYPNDKLCLIIGGDSLINLHTWHRYEELIELTHIVAMNRPGYQLTIPDYLEDRIVSVQDLAKSSSPKVALFNDTSYNLSSTKVRKLISQNDSVSELIPELVAQYISENKLYKTAVNQNESKMKDMTPEEIKDLVVEAIDDIKAQDIKVLDIADICNFADYMVVASGTSDTHVKAVGRSASTTLRQAGVMPLNENGADIGEWVLVDFGDVVLHVMRPEVRAYYDIEKLWDKDVRDLIEQHRQEQEAEDD